MAASRLQARIALRPLRPFLQICLLNSSFRLSSLNQLIKKLHDFTTQK